MSRRSKARAAERAGRKADPQAKRNQTTRKGRAGDNGEPGFFRQDVNAEQQMRRLRVAGDTKTSLDVPLDVLLAKGLVSKEMRDAGMAFALTAWSLFGQPAGSCEALYTRALSGQSDGATMRSGAAEESDEEIRRRVDAWRRYREMVSAVVGRPIPEKGPVYLPLSGTAIGAVRAVCQLLEMPRIVFNMANREASSRRDFADIARLADGLNRLVELQRKKDAASRRRRWARAPAPRIWTRTSGEPADGQDTPSADRARPDSSKRRPKRAKDRDGADRQADRLRPERAHAQP
jgi:hypothetical protein